MKALFVAALCFSLFSGIAQARSNATQADYIRDGIDERFRVETEPALKSNPDAKYRKVRVHIFAETTSEFVDLDQVFVGELEFKYPPVKRLVLTDLEILIHPDEEEVELPYLETLKTGWLRFDRRKPAAEPTAESFKVRDPYWVLKPYPGAPLNHINLVEGKVPIAIDGFLSTWIGEDGSVQAYLHPMNIYAVRSAGPIRRVVMNGGSPFVFKERVGAPNLSISERDARLFMLLFFQGLAGNPFRN